jgi:hypothetical protein
VETGGIIDSSKNLEVQCVPSGSYPVYCNPELLDEVEYPYCVFTMGGWIITTSEERQQRQESSDAILVCAKSGDQVSLLTANGAIRSSLTIDGQWDHPISWSRPFPWPSL